MKTTRITIMMKVYIMIPCSWAEIEDEFNLYKQLQLDCISWRKWNESGEKKVLHSPPYILSMYILGNREKKNTLCVHWEWVVGHYRTWAFRKVNPLRIMPTLNNLLYLLQIKIRKIINFSYNLCILFKYFCSNPIAEFRFPARLGHNMYIIFWWLNIVYQIWTFYYV